MGLEPDPWGAGDPVTWITKAFVIIVPLLVTNKGQWVKHARVCCSGVGLRALLHHHLWMDVLSVDLRALSSQSQNHYDQLRPQETL